MKIKKKQLCQLTGISPATLRYYVDEKIITPEQDRSNGYYYYSNEDALLLLGVRELRSFGFTMEEATSLIKQENTSVAYASILDQKREQLEIEKRILEEKIRILELRAQTEHQIADGAYLFHASAPWYAAFFDNQSSSSHAVRELNNLLPTSYLTLQLVPGQDGFRPGLTISSHDYARLKNVAPSGIILESLPAKRILLDISIPDLSSIRYDTFSPVLHYAKRHNFTIISNIFCVVRRVYSSHGRVCCDVTGGVCYTDSD